MLAFYGQGRFRGNVLSTHIRFELRPEGLPDQPAVGTGEYRLPVFVLVDAVFGLVQ